METETQKKKMVGYYNVNLSTVKCQIYCPARIKDLPLLWAQPAFFLFGRSLTVSVQWCVWGKLVNASGKEEQGAQWPSLSCPWWFRHKRKSAAPGRRHFINNHAALSRDFPYSSNLRPLHGCYRSACTNRGNLRGRLACGRSCVVTTAL